MPNHWIITFESVHYVMKAEKVLKEKGFKVLLIPTPREMSSDCGVALELSGVEIGLIKEVLNNHRLSPEGYFKKGVKENGRFENRHLYL